MNTPQIITEIRVRNPYEHDEVYLTAQMPKECITAIGITFTTLQGTQVLISSATRFTMKTRPVKIGEQDNGKDNPQEI